MYVYVQKVVGDRFQASEASSDKERDTRLSQIKLQMQKGKIKDMLNRNKMKNGGVHISVH